MTPDLKAKWIAALRSGEYQQETGRLRSSVNSVNRFCCLGVLCEVSGIDINRNEGPAYRQITEVAGLPWRHVSKCMDMNDQLRYPFSDIADYVERAV